jgi:hypothetical protein
MAPFSLAEFVCKPKRHRGQTDWFKENILGNPVDPQRPAIAPSPVVYGERQGPITPVNLPDRSAPQPVLTPAQQADKDFYCTRRFKFVFAIDAKGHAAPAAIVDESEIKLAEKIGKAGYQTNAEGQVLYDVKWISATEWVRRRNPPLNNGARSPRILSEIHRTGEIDRGGYWRTSSGRELLGKPSRELHRKLQFQIIPIHVRPFLITD